MKNLKIQSSTIHGSISIPSSKSQSHRALIFGAMGNGKTEIQNLLRSPDTEGMIQAWRQLGAKFEESQDRLMIEGLGGKIEGSAGEIDVGNSGVALRFLSGLFALSSTPITITGDDSIQSQRPMQSTIDALNQLGAKVVSVRGNGLAPLVIQGPILGGITTVDGQDSQHVSSLLIAALFAKNPTTIHVTNPGETTWVDLTLHWLDRLKANYTRDGYTTYRVQGNHRYQGFSYTVPGDLSSAAFPLAAAVITHSELTLQNIDMNELQGDKKIVPILQEMGADITVDSDTKTLRVGKNSDLTGMTVDINDCIDTITILATIACFAAGTTKIINAKNAKNKECDRIACIAEELNKMGGDVTPTEDGLIIAGQPLTGTTVHSYSDHRMAMSLVVAGMGAKGETTITDTACIAKTYPTFVEDLKNCGVKIVQ